MDKLEHTCASLRAQITATETQLAGLRRELESAEKAALEIKKQEESTKKDGNGDSRKPEGWPLLNEEYRRYGRQMIVPQLGLQGQLKLRSSKVLIVGAGGLGCPAALYLAGAGVGTLGLVDGDTVDFSNLHRQVLHRRKNVGKLKVDSAIEYLQKLNHHCTYVAHRAHLTPQDAPEIFKGYNLILDCTDNPASRYLISDAAVVLGKPLVSASALRTEGQLMVLNNPPRPVGDTDGGPCYRCVFPKPPPANSVTSCADGGIIGPVVGTMGLLQALEAIKVITKNNDASASATPREPPLLHMFSAYSSPMFRSIKLRPRRANCAACSAEPTVTLDTLKTGSMDYVFFCGVATPEAVLSPEERISPLEYRTRHPANLASNAVPGSMPHTIIDVREKVQFDICNISNSINIPFSSIFSSSLTARPSDNEDKLPPWLPTDIAAPDSTDPVYVVCRLGNDSQVAVRKLKELGLDHGGKRFIGDIEGGLHAWRRQVDPEWPEY